MNRLCLLPMFGFGLTLVACSGPSSMPLTDANAAAIPTVEINDVAKFVSRGLASPHYNQMNAMLSRMTVGEFNTALAGALSDAPVNIGGHIISGLKTRFERSNDATDRMTIGDLYAQQHLAAGHPFGAANYSQVLQAAVERFDAGEKTSLSLATPATPTKAADPTTTCKVIGVVADTVNSNSAAAETVGTAAASGCVGAIAASCLTDGLVAGIGGSEVPIVGNVIGVVAGCSWGMGTAAAACAAAGTGLALAPTGARHLDNHDCNDSPATY